MAVPTDLPLVTAAILAYNRRDQLATTLEMLRRLDWPNDRLETIVVDNASEDGTAEMVRERFPAVEVIVSPTNDGIAGWNRAFERGRGEYFLVLDDDCYVTGDGLLRAVTGAREEDADMVSFAVDSTDPDTAFSDFYKTGLLSFWGCAVLISRRAVRELGGFDGNLFIWAHELEFTMRFLDRGFRHLFRPDLHALHMKGIAPPRADNHFRNMRNFGYVAAKLLQPADAVRAIGSLLVRAGIEGLIDRHYLAGARHALLGARSGLRVREPVRPAVSRLYRRNFIDLSSPVRPLDRWRYYFHSGADRPTDYHQVYYRVRPRLYPSRPAALRVPLG